MKYVKAEEVPALMACKSLHSQPGQRHSECIVWRVGAGYNEARGERTWRIRVDITFHLAVYQHPADARTPVRARPVQPIP